MVRSRIVFASLLAMTVATPASAEVMDKELSISAVWGWALLGGLAGVVAIQLRWWLGLITLPMAALGPFGALVEFRSFDVGPAIVRAAGASYGNHAVAALILVTVLHGMAWATRLWMHAKRVSLNDRGHR